MLMMMTVALLDGHQSTPHSSLQSWRSFSCRFVCRSRPCFAVTI